VRWGWGEGVRLAGDGGESDEHRGTTRSFGNCRFEAGPVRPELGTLPLWGSVRSRERKRIDFGLPGERIPRIRSCRQRQTGPRSLRPRELVVEVTTRHDRPTVLYPGFGRGHLQAWVLPESRQERRVLPACSGTTPPEDQRWRSSFPKALASAIPTSMAGDLRQRRSTARFSTQVLAISTRAWLRSDLMKENQGSPTSRRGIVTGMTGR